MRWVFANGSPAIATPTPQMPAVAMIDVDVLPLPSFDEVYEAHFAFVWRVLRTFGVPDTALEDAAQDVFVVVHRRLFEFEGRAVSETYRSFCVFRRHGSAWLWAGGQTCVAGSAQSPS